MQLNNILHGDCLDKLKELSDNSIDAIITDPPYQLDSISDRYKNTNISKEHHKRKKLETGGKDGVFARQIVGFLGKKWDVLPPVETWKECLRVLKPGAFAMIMTTTRQDSLCKLLTDLTAAGFNMGFSSMYWSYSSGFPKATNISKAIDRQIGIQPKIVGYAKSNSDFKDRGKNVKKLHGLNKLGVGVSSTRQQTPITIPTSNDAKRFEGAFCGFQPKPSVEMILVCMKPLDKKNKTFIAQALDNGHGVTYLDDCRIPYTSENDYVEYKEKQESFYGAKSIGKIVKGKTTFLSGDIISNKPEANLIEKGRFPANLLVSDNILDTGKITKSTGGTGTASTGNLGGHSIRGKATELGSHAGGLGDSGDYSRYFNIDAWYDKMIMNLPKDIQKTFPFIITPKPSTKEKSIGLAKGNANSYNKKCIKCNKWQIAQKSKTGSKYKCICEEPEYEDITGNTHCTVKPIKLFAYLTMLTSREGDIILDPFAGSGTTLLAAAMLGRNFIGIELEAEHIEIIKQRLGALNEYIEEYRTELSIKSVAKSHNFW